MAGAKEKNNKLPCLCENYACLNKFANTAMRDEQDREGDAV
jgi:hypothetical protein